MYLLAFIASSHELLCRSINRQFVHLSPFLGRVVPAQRTVVSLIFVLYCLGKSSSHCTASAPQIHQLKILSWKQPELTPWQVIASGRTASRQGDVCCFYIHLARCFDPFPDAEVHDGEDQQQAEGQLPANAPQVIQPVGPVHLQDLAAARGKKNTVEIFLNKCSH